MTQEQDDGQRSSRLQNSIPVPAMTTSLYERFASRIDERISAKIIAVLRNDFGGHLVKKEGNG